MIVATMPRQFLIAEVVKTTATSVIVLIATTIATL